MKCSSRNKSSTPDLVLCSCFHAFCIPILDEQLHYEANNGRSVRLDDPATAILLATPNQWQDVLLVRHSVRTLVQDDVQRLCILLL